MSSASSRLSTASLRLLVERLKAQSHRDSTRETYYWVWKQFARFYQRLDHRPESWEERIVLFVGHLIKQKKQSSTIRTYFSALRAVLKIDDIELNENLFLINALTKACKLKNDRIRTRQPITRGLLNRIVGEVERYYESPEVNQFYLSKMFKALFVTAYYGLFRVGELTSGAHPVLARDVEVGTNKKKLRFTLRSSKTHRRNNRPQTVKISSIKHEAKPSGEQPDVFNFCPYEILREYGQLRGPITQRREPFFVLSDHSPVKPFHMTNCLKFILKRLNKNSDLFSVHSFRIGRSNDLLKMGLSVETIKKLGRWWSNAVFRYLR